MKRLLAALALASFGFGLFATAPASQAAATGTTVTIGQFIAYDAGSAFPLTICVDGTAQNFNWVPAGSTTQPFTLSPGTHTFVFDPHSVCLDPPFLSVDLVIPEGGPVTVLAYWPESGPTAEVLADTTCAGPDTSTLSFRHGAATGPVDVYATPTDGTETKILSNVASGAQADAVLPAGTYSDVVARPAGDTESVIADIGPVDATDPSVITATIYAGDDGDIGSHVAGVAADPCAAPVEPTTTTSTVAAPAAEAVATAPAFTG